MSNGDYLVLTRCQRGWRCEVSYSAATGDQFTDLTFVYTTRAHWWWLALLRGWFGARGEKRFIESIESSRRAAKGWN